MSNAALPEGIEGFCDERFVSVAEILAKQIAAGDHHGAAVAAYLRGEPVVDIWGGKRATPGGSGGSTERSEVTPRSEEVKPWEKDTLAICMSTTKGVAATALHMVMERTDTSYDTPVADVWPEFGVNGKDKITIRQVLCHEAGVPQIRDQVPDVWVLPDWDRMVAVMESLEPIWEPGTANGYHALNFGWLVGEILRRIDGRDISTFLAEEVAGPLELDGLYIGTPVEEHGRIAQMLAPEMSIPNADSEYDARLPKDSPIWKALSPRGSIIDLFNTPEGKSSCIPAISGAFTARSLAKMYAALERGGEVAGVRILEPETVATATTVQNDRADLVLYMPIRYRLGYWSGGGSAVRALGPNDDIYGHVGAGGTFAAVDPGSESSFALTYDKFGATELLGGPRSTVIADAVIESAAACL